MSNDDRLRAIIAESKRNNASNPAVAADTAYKPSAWTEEQEAELVERIHGSEAERLDKLIAEHNEAQRRR